MHREKARGSHRVDSSSLVFLFLKGRERREKSRTPKEERRERDKDKTKKVEKEKEPTKIEKKDSKNEQRAEEQTLERKRLDFSSATASTVEEEHNQQLAMVSEEDSKRRKKTRFSDSEDEHQENKEKPPSETSSKNGAKSEAPSMALTMRRLQDMSVSTPVRGDGTKTPLRIPPTEIQKHRKPAPTPKGLAHQKMRWRKQKTRRQPP